MIKAIFFDIDGTLVSFQTHRMPERVKEALWTLRRQGVKLFVASGRPMININNLEGFPFDGFITMNGALTYLDGKIVDRHPLTQEDARKVAALATELDTTAWVFTEDSSGVNQMTAKATAFSERIHIFPSGFVDLERMAETTDIYEYTFFISLEDEYKLLRPILSHADYPRWHPDFTDIVAKGLSKASAASILLDRLGIGREECMAFGDGGNDVPLIEYAGIGVAMGNAAEAVKAVADLVTRSVDEDGIVAALEHLGLF